MLQTALMLDTPAPLPDVDATGAAIGWDHARHGLVPPPEHLHAGHPVHEGWLAGRAAFGSRVLRASPAVRRWLQLRLRAWLRGQVVEDMGVTPNFIAQLDAGECPVTREPLPEDDAWVVRVFDGAAHAAGNLALLGRRAAAAKSTLAWDDALAFARRIEAGHAEQVAGLDGAAWARLGVLMSFATPLRHAQVASLPLLVLPPNRLRVINPAQALQVMLTRQFLGAGYARRLAELSPVLPAAARQDFHLFMHTLLARRLAAGTQAGPAALRRAMEDAWLHPLVQRRWCRLSLKLNAAQCERIVQYAARRGLMDEGCRWLPPAAAVDGWALGASPIGGTRDAAQERTTSANRHRRGALPCSPGEARSRPSFVPACSPSATMSRSIPTS